jgi:Uma2 family endonuclease
MRDAAARRLSEKPDTTFYPVDDDMGEGLLHRDIADVLRFLLQRYLTQQGQVARVGANQFIYWEQFHPEVTLAPDVYVLPGVTPETTLENWKVWETGIVPSFAFEVVSKYPKKDYEEILPRYGELGVPEVIVFDHRGGRPRSKRVRWQVYRRIGKRGLVLVEKSNADRVRSKALGCWLRMVGEDSQVRVRVGTGSEGDTLFPTEAEEIEHADVKLGAALAELERLREEVARLRR